MLKLFPVVVKYDPVQQRLVDANEIPRRKIHQTLYELREFRNRVAHHEALLAGSEFERRKIISVASRLLSKEAFDHLTQNREVLKILGGRAS
jgi:hypothetical protein